MSEQHLAADPRLAEMGPIDYIVVEWPDRQPKGQVAPHLLELVDRGIIRVLDIALVTKGEDGAIAAIDFGELEPGHALGDLAGAASGLLGQEDLEEAANALEPGTAAAVLIWENRWAAPFATALRQSGGELVASGRLAIADVIDRLDALESAGTTT